MARVASGVGPVGCEQAHMASKTAPPKRPRVLIVDDDPGVARGLARGLRRVADVVMELEPAAALERVKCGERFDLVLCDVMMPGMSGPELFERVVACAPELAAAFVFASGGMPAQVQERLRATGRPCLEKPISIAALLELLVPSVPTVE